MATYRAHPITAVFPALSPSDFETLKKDIDDNGLLEPIWLDKNKQIIDGRHRYRACRELKIEADCYDVDYPEEDIPALVVSLNLRRRHMTATQKAMVAANLVPFYSEAAKKRKLDGLKQGDAKPVRSEKSQREEAGKAADLAGRVVGVSGSSVKAALKVQSDGCELLQEMLEAGTVPVSDAALAAKETKAVQKRAAGMVQKGKAKNLKGALKSIKQEQQIKEIEALDPLTGGYPVIVADPPWPYEARKADTTQRGQTPYPQMSLDQICQMEVPSADDSILFLWVTNSHLVNGNAARVCAAWGYQPKTLITWVKDRMGTGDWARSQTEHIAVAVRGKPKLKEVPRTYFEAPRGEHSVKPGEFYELVERCTAGSKAELFSRQKRDGWFCHGHELNKGKPKVKRQAAVKKEVGG